MARIMMTTSANPTAEQVFSFFISATAARGAKDKTLDTYKQHFRSISKRLDTSIPIGNLTKVHLDDMISEMRADGLSSRSINSYTRTLKTFLSWCNSEGYTSLNIPIYKASESTKETYSDDELLILLKKPRAGCNFCEYRNWVIINFLLNSGCRAATVRNIQIQDVYLQNRQILLRHTKNGKLQTIPLCMEMVSILQEYMQIRGGSRTDYLFCNEFGNYLSESALRQTIVKYNRKRGIKRTSIHAFRHTFARKYLVDCGGDAFTLQRILGHSTLAMTKHYCNIFNSDIVDKYESLSPLAQLKKTSGKYIKK
ncbi:MAG: site-specific integrase [Oscillospiraceae bacterium]|nr:site-specific integrase [Oscillospiraceae bacterium]